MRDMEEERERENVAMTQFAHVETELGNGSVIKSGWSKYLETRYLSVPASIHI